MLGIKKNIQITEALTPTVLEIIDDSTSHGEHEAMRDNGFNETHFKVLVVSEAFKPKVIAIVYINTLN